MTPIATRIAKLARNDNSAAAPQVIRHELSGRTILGLIAVGAGGWLVFRLWPILLVVAVALILVGTLSPVVLAMERRGIGRPWAVAIVSVMGVAIAFCAGILIIPPLWRQVLWFAQEAPAIQARVADALERQHLATPLANGIRHFAPEKLMLGESGNALAYSSSIVEVLGYATSSIVLALYLIADRTRALGALYAATPRRFHIRLARIILKSQTIVGGYIRGQLVTSLAICVFTFALLAVCGVPGPLALAILAGAADVIPFIGGFLAAGPAVVAASALGPQVALFVVVAMLLYQVFEDRVLVPRVYARTLRLPPAGVIVALLIGGKLLGILGGLLALPIAAALRMVIEELRVDLPGDDSDDSELRERDERVERAYAQRTSGAAPNEAAAVAIEIVATGQAAEDEGTEP